ncbi:aminoglycoside phosphotransferase family protein [Deinococcus cellulosilyticus]|uniref:Aminoglycoside phosphotransferase domain-containing protein n=1 Tax=Deinococcus cellulosilyticus (strain DSM 18568 / NBRC 106333 / KACC 11606 / 5516J-15) TaxID=1223518 RepID=A0A511MXV7_DEIC1|nr:aminoglycoside phosphotransferase family protein [Deinococcus cellulosilyticus]GEM45410.1 hypothetical protein DC3_10450 [Deinococcus cellulosilyticus NBRC 106333 = KACC 11606]
MPAEPTLHQNLMLQKLKEAHGLSLNSLQFIPAGTAPAYRAEGEDGRFFIKVLPDTPYGQEVLGRLQRELPLLQVLRAQGILPEVPEVVLTLQGEGFTCLEGHALVVYRWIDGESLGDAGWLAARNELVVLLGRLHAGTSRIMQEVRDLPFPPEDFELPFEDQLVQDLQVLEQLPDGARRGTQALRDLLAPHLAAIQRVLQHARVFQQQVRNRSPELVVCHTDAHGGNVMRNSSGRLWIIDWETARLAPREHDLWMLHAHLPELLPRYEQAVGQPVQLDSDMLGFYFYRRVLEDLAMDVRMILHDNTRPEEDEANLRVLEQYILPALHQVNTDFEHLSTRLASR